jgi:hypothetical protein
LEIVEANPKWISNEINPHGTPAGAILERFFLLLLVGGGGRTGNEFK